VSDDHEVCHHPKGGRLMRCVGAKTLTKTYSFHSTRVLTSSRSIGSFVEPPAPKVLGAVLYRYSSRLTSVFCPGLAASEKDQEAGSALDTLTTASC